MPIKEPSGVGVYSPKIRDQALVRKFISRNGYGYVGISITGPDRKEVNADPGTIHLGVWFNDVSDEYEPSNPWGTQIIDVGASEIVHEDKGKYHYDIGPEHTQYRGVLTAKWTYEVNGVELTFLDHLQILGEMPLYETLTNNERIGIEQVSWMIGDLFDSTDGGPWLTENFQTHFDYERLAQMQKLALYRINMTAWPVTYYDTGKGANNCPPAFNPLLVFGTYLEVVRHLRDSYTEIPLFQQMNVTYTDRRDYMGRWNQIFQEEWPEYKHMITMAKRKLLNLGRGALLVAGGIYGGNAMGLFQVGTYASQVRSWRFYPAAPALAWSSTHSG